MDTISLAILGITAWFLFFGLVWGFKRGVFRSVLRLLTLGAAFAAAWFGKDVYVAAVMDAEVDGVGVRALLQELTAEAPALSGVIESLAELILGVVLFILVFLVFKFVTFIIFGVLKIFVPKKKRLLGMIVGLIQGALIAFCVCAPLNGLLVDVAKLSDLDMGDMMDTSAVQEIGAEAKVYTEGSVSALYTAVGDEFYKALTAKVNEKGETLYFSDYVDATVSSAKLTDVFSSVAELDMSAGLTADNRDAIQQMFKDLDAITAEMGENAAVVVNEIVSAVVSDFGEELPESVKGVLEDFDMTEVSFAKEGEIVMDLYDFLENEESEITVTDVVNSLAESDVILPVVESVLAEEETHLEIADEEIKAEVNAAIAGIEDPAVREQLKNLFGL